MRNAKEVSFATILGETLDFVKERRRQNGGSSPSSLDWDTFFKYCSTLDKRRLIVFRLVKRVHQQNRNAAEQVRDLYVVTKVTERGWEVFKTVCKQKEILESEYPAKPFSHPLVEITVKRHHPNAKKWIFKPHLVKFIGEHPIQRNLAVVCCILTHSD